jgi:(S)-2-hydroxyglutarate dehydrogenase
VIVGAGIVGLAIARELVRREPDASITVLEKEHRLGEHASGRNSGVLHTGIYYPAGTLKAKLCRAGAEAMLDYAAAHGISSRRDGKVIIATCAEDAGGLDALLANARAAGVRAERIDSEGIRELEPHAANEFGGVHCADTAVIDSSAVLESLRDGLERAGVDIVHGEQVVAIDERRRELRTSQCTRTFGLLVNAAGAHADTVARMAGVGREYRLVPFKGLYYKFTPEHAARVRGSIYPVPNPNLPFLGIHFTRVINGDVYVGPTAIPALGRENYGLLAGARPVEAARIVLQLARLYARNQQNFRALVHAELPRYAPGRFLRAASRLVDRLEPEWLKRSPKVGIRPQLLNSRTGRLEMDFVVERGERSVHVLNAISPAFTSSFAFASFVVETMYGHP